MIDTVVGEVASLHRYPVKSMLGESIPSVGLSASGVVGDRAYALIDNETNKVISVKRLNGTKFRADRDDADVEAVPPARRRVGLEHLVSEAADRQDAAECLNCHLARVWGTQTRPVSAGASPVSGGKRREPRGASRWAVFGDTHRRRRRRAAERGDRPSTAPRRRSVRPPSARNSPPRAAGTQPARVADALQPPVLPLGML